MSGYSIVELRLKAQVRRFIAVVLERTCEGVFMAQDFFKLSISSGYSATEPKTHIRLRKLPWRGYVLLEVDVFRICVDLYAYHHHFSRFYHDTTFVPSHEPKAKMHNSCSLRTQTCCYWNSLTICKDVEHFWGICHVTECIWIMDFSCNRSFPPGTIKAEILLIMKNRY